MYCTFYNLTFDSQLTQSNNLQKSIESLIKNIDSKIPYVRFAKTSTQCVLVFANLT